MIKLSLRSLFFLFLFIFTTSSFAADSLPSWNNTKTKEAIIRFVKDTTNPSTSHFIRTEDRIAVFDQDGTLWVEHPLYTQVIFAFSQVAAMSKQHPEWKQKEPFKSILENNKAAIEKFSPKDLQAILIATHTGMSVETFQLTVKKWLEKAKHPRWNKPYTDLVYQPMIELLKYLRANGFKTYIVTGGGQDFVRAYAEKVYGIPPEQIIGTALKTKYTYDAKGKGVLMRMPELMLDDNFGGKPEGIHLFIGRRSVAASGNSTGDQQMLEYTQDGGTASLMLLIHHDDEKREYAYDANTKVGTFSDALMKEAGQRGWHVVSMRDDWKRVFAFEESNSRI